MSLDGFSLKPLIDELNEKIAGGRIDRICQPNKQDVYFYIRQPRQTHILYLSINPQNPMVNITPVQPENPPEPPVFCMVLRKQLEGGRIASISQYGLDRMALIDIDTLGPKGVIITKTLVAELMGKYSNLILMQDGTIIDAFRKVGENNNRVRTVLPGHQYELPPVQDKLNILNANSEDFIERVKKYKEGTLYQAILASALGFGPVSVQEVIYLAGLYDDLLIKEMDNSDFQSLQKAIDEIKSCYLQKEFSPTLVLDKKQKIKAMTPFALHIFLENKFTVQTFDTMNDLMEQSKSFVNSNKIPEKDTYLKIIHNEINRLVKKEKILAEEFSKAQKAEKQKIKADNLMTYQYQFTDHKDKEISVPNIYDENGALIKITLDTKLTLIQNAQAYYKKYDKLKRSQEMLQIQIKQCHRDKNYAQSIEAALDTVNTFSDIEDIKQEMIKAGFIPPDTKKKASVAPSKPYKFKLPNDMTLYVGKNNYQNDKLTFKVAHNDDIWLHTKDIPGSHVIIDTKGDEIDEDTIFLAAQIAGYFSKARNSSKIPVDYVQRKYVKKPSGAKPGFVIFTNNKTLYVTPDEEQIQSIINYDLNKK
ncbi:Rqc2 family fibronectin-binding protein [Megamonas hypermegale]|uniref:Rqc2 family fibronectin-binding protein n=1 Tax=Megamonas hypermegale TaxID=158847 RepID=UPI00195B74A2|nr:NFACT RNA binding domain-containing protein [Megamonas hypermegale]MBM6833127.1 NFACT family protein [Megamonas hypermegale]